MSNFVERTWRGEGGLSLYARDYAGSGGPARCPVVCIHGLTRNSGDFEEVAPWIAAQGRRVLAIDVRGRGRSDRDPDPARYHPRVYAGDVLALLDGAGIARAVFIGTSMGGIITMAVAFKRLRAVAAAVLNDVGPVLSMAGLRRIAGYVGKGSAVENWDDAAAYIRSINEVAFPGNTQADWQAWAKRTFRARRARPAPAGLRPEDRLGRAGRPPEAHLARREAAVPQARAQSPDPVDPRREFRHRGPGGGGLHAKGRASLCNTPRFRASDTHPCSWSPPPRPPWRAFSPEFPSMNHLRAPNAMPRTPPPRAKRGRPVRAPRTDVAMPELLLDHAEALFARHGFHGVTVREVARLAGVDSALVHYYFETKQGLFDAVFTRRSDVLNEERMRSMDDYARAAGDAISVEGCIEAFLEPIRRRSLEGDPGWKNYFRLVALVNNTYQWGGQMMTRTFDPVIRRLIELLRRCMPEADDADLFWCYHFLSGALTLSLSETGRIDRLSAGLCTSTDVEAIYRRMVPFMAAGFRHVCLQGTRAG